MRSLIIFSANVIIWLSTWPSWLKWLWASYYPESVQSKTLKTIINQQLDYSVNKDHAYDYLITKYLHCTNYHDIEPSITELGLNNIWQLTKEKPLFFTPTSGSTSGTKLIPYTKMLRKQFKAGLNVWINRLYASELNMLFSSSYWLITHSIRPDQENKGIKLSYDDDSLYLGRFRRYCLMKTLAVPPQIAAITNGELLLTITFLMLILDKRLGFISLWSPSFWFSLLNNAQKNKDQLLKVLATGICPESWSLTDAVDVKLKRILKSKRRFELLEKLNKFGFSPVFFQAIWPRIKIISVWSESSSQSGADNMMLYFPSARLQPKSLIATEAIISIPCGFIGNYPALVSHFFEFIDLEDNRKKIISSLEMNHQYRVIVTTGGGLYRYNLDDIVRVAGYYHKLPNLVFMGRTNVYSDLVGEKLNAYHVEKLLKHILENNQLDRPDFWLLHPIRNHDNKINYRLILHFQENVVQVDDLIIELEKSLRLENYHYDLARRLNQLDALTIQLSTQTLTELLSIYHHTKILENKKSGDIKIINLDSSFIWQEVFQ